MARSAGISTFCPCNVIYYSQARGVVGASVSNARIFPDFDRLTDTVRAMCAHEERESTGSTNGEC